MHEIKSLYKSFSNITTKVFCSFSILDIVFKRGSRKGNFWKGNVSQRKKCIVYRENRFPQKTVLFETANLNPYEITKNSAVKANNKFFSSQKFLSLKYKMLLYQKVIWCFTQVYSKHRKAF